MNNKILVFLDNSGNGTVSVWLPDVSAVGLIPPGPPSNTSPDKWAVTFEVNFARNFQFVATYATQAEAQAVIDKWAAAQG